MTKHIPTDILLEAQRQMDVVAKIAHQRQVSDYQVKIVAKQLGVSPRTVRRMVRRYRNMPTLDVFLSRRYRTGSRYARIRKCGETEAIVQKILEERYIGREEEITLPKVLELINQQCRQSGADELSLGTLYRRVDQLEQRLKNSAKRRKTGLQPRQSKSGKLVTTRPLEHLQIDHTMVDKMLDLSPWGLGIRRPWLTLIIDIATRGIWGYYLSLVRPNVNACALAMMSGFIPKNVLVSRLGISLEPFQEKGIDEPWPCHGKGEIIHHDNAKEFLSPRFQWGVNYLGMKSQPRPIGKPHYGGHIERLIGRFMADVRMLPGTTFNNTVVRDDYPSEAKAGMTIEEFEVWLVLNILRYHMSVHHALGCSPYDQYRRLAAVTPKSPVRIPSLPEVRRAFLRWETRVIREGGIVLKHRHYNTDRLGPYLGQNVSIGWQDNDMSRIFVSLDHTFDHLEVPLAPHERQQRYWELWDKTSPRYGRVQEDARQKDLAAQLLKEMIEFGDQTKRIGHRPKLPKQIPEPCSAVTIQAPSKTQQQSQSVGEAELLTRFNGPLVVLGPPGVGKTELLKSLMGHKQEPVRAKALLRMPTLQCRLSDNRDDWSLRISGLVSQTDDDSSTLALDIMGRLGFERFDNKLIAQAVVSETGILIDPINEERRSVSGTLHRLYRTISVEKAPEVLDELVTLIAPFRFEDKDRWQHRDRWDARHRIANFTNELLQLLIAANSVALTADSILRWLRSLGSDSGYQRDAKDKVAKFFEENHEMRYSIQHLALSRIKDEREFFWESYKLGKLSPGLQLRSTD